MIDVVDRVPSQPGRYKMTLPDGSTQYVTLERADEPTVAGTPINKALFESIKEDLNKLNSNFAWKLLNSVNNGSVDISSVFGSANEYNVIIGIAPTGSANYKYVSNVILAEHLNQTLTYLNGWYYDDKYKATVATCINPTNKTIGIDSSWTTMYDNSTSKVSYNYLVAVYYR